MHVISTCEYCGELLDGEITFDIETTEDLQTLGAQISVSYTLCDSCNMVNEIVNYKELSLA